jgi:histidine kinase-like protein
MQQRAARDERVVQAPPARDPNERAAGSVRVIVPAGAEQPSILRSVATGTAAKAGLSVDAIEDLRIAVTEAAGRLLNVGPARELSLEMEPEHSRVTVTVSADAVGTPSGAWLGPAAAGSIGWALIEGLCDEAADEIRDGRPTTVLTVGSRPMR